MVVFLEKGTDLLVFLGHLLFNFCFPLVSLICAHLTLARNVLETR